jgi:predicted  nucleic acid-binding Zn-ribbon protein
LTKVEEKLKSGWFASDKNLPKIGSSTNITTKNSSNNPSIDLLRKDVQNTNEELNKTNEKLETLKKNMKELEAAHNLIPNRISKLETQVTQIN